MGELLSGGTFKKAMELVAAVEQAEDIAQGLVIAMLIRLWTGTLREVEIADEVVNEAANEMEKNAAEMVSEMNAVELKKFLTMGKQTDLLKSKLRKLMIEMDGA